MILIDGKKVAAELRVELKQEVSELKAKYNKVPGLTVILIGDMAPSQIYVRMKEKAANEVGLKSEVIRYPGTVEEKTVLDKIEELNKDNNVSGILVQLPLPKHIDKQKVIESILPSKDVDGFHPVNVGNLSSGYESTIPCTPLGCYLLIKKFEKNLSGKKVAAELRVELKQEVSELKAKYNKVPGLTVILIGDMAPSQIYVRMKEKAANEVGLKSEVIRYPESVEEKTVLDKINELNNDESVSGILVQLPLPKHIDKQKVIEAIAPTKDVDGFHPVNVGNLSSGYESTVPCTPLGCYLLIKKFEKNLSGKKAVIVGRSNLNGKPMTQLLLKENCTVTITHSKTKDLKAECLEADIIVAAVGMPELVKGDWVKKDAIVIDVGINKTDKGIVGDVAFDEVSKVAKALTPVPGGIGPMTIACLLKNTVECFKRFNS